jgi:photosystem II stability/assembly factor-like uncharacterized protein
MKPKKLLSLALVLSAGLSGCAELNERPAPPPNAAADWGAYICEIQMADERNGWAMTGGVVGRQLVLRTTDGGQSWRDCTPRAVRMPGNIEGAICSFGSQHAWLPTFQRITGVAGLLRTKDGGKSWAWVKTAPFLRELHFFDANRGFAREEDDGLGSAYVRFYETQDGGANWKPVPIIPPDAEPGANGLPAMIHLCNLCGDRMAFHPPAEVIIAHGDMGDETPKNAVRLSMTANLGKTWRDVRLPLPSAEYRAGLVEGGLPVFLDAKHGWLQAQIRENDGNTFAFKGMALYATQDGGQSWTPKPEFIESGSDSYAGHSQFDFVSARDIFAVGGANLYVTHDGARSWRAIQPDIDLGRAGSKRDVLQLDFVDATHGWAVIYDNTNDLPDGHDSLYRTSDGGAAWKQLPLQFAQ